MNVRRLLVCAVSALTVVAANPLPAHAWLTVCDNPGDSGTVLYSSTQTVPGVGTVEVTIGTAQTWIAVTSGPLAPFEVGIDVNGINNTNPATVCVDAPVIGNTWFGLLTSPAPAGYVGAFVGVNQCYPGPSCTFVLRYTGVMLNTSVPLASCIRVLGVEQNPLCTI